MSRAALRSGAALTALAAVAAAAGLRAAGMASPDVAALVVLLVILPALSVLQVGLVGGEEVPRMPAYAGSAVSLVVLGGAAWAVGERAGGSGVMGLQGIPFGPFAAWTAALVAGGLAVTSGFRVLGKALGWREEPLLRALLPRTPRERWAFAGLSVAAGLGEELAYRGYVMGALGAVVGGPWAAVISSAVFGVLHVYQGLLGMARTAALGGLLAASLLVAGSLWPAVAAHVVLDVLLGIVLAERMMVPTDPSGVP